MEFERLAVRYMSIDLDEWFYVFPFSGVLPAASGMVIDLDGDDDHDDDDCEMVDCADYVIGYRGMLVRLVDDPWEQYSFIEIMDVEGGAQ